MTTRIRIVDTMDDDVVDDLTDLHVATFTRLVELPDFERGFWWVAYDGSEPVGFAGLTQTFADTKVGYLKRAGVIESYRGRGLQRALIRVRERAARRLGMTLMVTDTTENPSSSNNLIACGYRLFSPKNPWAWEHTLYWKKTLVV